MHCKCPLMTQSGDRSLLSTPVLTATMPYVGGDMRRRDFLAGLSGALAGWPLAARGQQPQKSARLGYLAPAANADLLAALREGLRDFGYVEGRNLSIDFRYYGQSKSDDELAAELVRLKPDAIVVVGTPTGPRGQTSDRDNSHHHWRPPPIRCARVLWRASPVPVATSPGVIALRLRASTQTHGSIDRGSSGNPPDRCASKYRQSAAWLPLGRCRADSSSARVAAPHHFRIGLQRTANDILSYEA